MISKEEIRHLAKLARLQLNEEEIESLTEDLNKILEYVGKINELNLESFPPLTNILDNLSLRRDEIKESDFEIIQKILDNFPDKENNYLKVPKILEK